VKESDVICQYKDYAVMNLIDSYYLQLMH